MKITMDRAGRLVIPRGIREQARLEAGAPLEIRFRDGRIEIEPSPRPVEIVRHGRLRVAVPVGEATPLTAEEVRTIRDRVRARR